MDGHLYEINLVTLFLMRATGAGYDFELTSNNEKIGGKFDDVIFRYRITDKETDLETWRYRYLQAKHKIDSSKKIKSIDLLEPVGDFSLQKYFQSYSMIVARGDDIEDCIICTNVGFDDKELEKNGISLVPDSRDEKILDFGGSSANVKNPLRCRLKFADEKRKELEEEWSDCYILAKQLEKCATEKRITDPRIEIFKMYHVALVKEKVIDLESKQFHLDFINGLDTLSPGAKLLRQTLCHLTKEEKWKTWQFKLNKDFGTPDEKSKELLLPFTSKAEKLQGFFDKLVFVVDSPSQNEFKDFLKKDMSKYYSTAESENRTTIILGDLGVWFTRLPRKWLSPKFGADVLLKGVREFSDEEQKRLEEHRVNFRDEAIDAMKTNLEKESKPYGSIASQWPDWTAVKVIRAIEAANEENKGNDDTCRKHCWLTQFKKLHEHKSLWRNRIKLMEKVPGKHYHVVICDESSVCPELMKNIREGITMVIIGKSTDDAKWEDVIRFQDLDETTTSKLLARKINLQTTEIKLECLIPPEGRDDVLDFLSIQELLGEQTITVQPPSNTSGYNPDLYIDRTLSFLFHGCVKDLNDKVQSELKKKLDEVKPSDSTEFITPVRINEKGQIEWLTEDEKLKSETWKVVTKTMDEMVPKDNLIHIHGQDSFPEENLINTDQQRVIITGVAGTGKSQLLSHLCHKICDRYPTHVLLKTSLVDHRRAMEKLLKQAGRSPIDRQIAIKFFLEVGLDRKTSLFIHSLIKHRLETGDRILVFLDGFDEIDKSYQDALVQLLKQLPASVRVYITTRVHMAHSLEYEFSQLAYELMNIPKEDQVNYLTNIWQISKKLRSIEKLKDLADILVEKVNESQELVDFMGIPLQCRMLAETYEPKIVEISNELERENEVNDEELRNRFLNLVKGGKFDTLSMYENLMKTKKTIFSNEKTKIGQENDVVSNLIWKVSKRHLVKLAIREIVLEENVIQILSKSFGKIKQSEEKELNSLAITYGIVSRRSETTDYDKLQFLHRTYAEYFIAIFVYNGFRLDVDHNDLLASEEVRKWIRYHLFDDDNYNGVRMFLNSMLEKKDLFAGWRGESREKENIPNSYIKELVNNHILSDEYKVPTVWKTKGQGMHKFLFSCCICFGNPLTLAKHLIIISNHCLPEAIIQLESGVFEFLLDLLHHSHVGFLPHVAIKIARTIIYSYKSLVEVESDKNYARNKARFLKFLIRIGPLFTKRNWLRPLYNQGVISLSSIENLFDAIKRVKKSNKWFKTLLMMTKIISARDYGFLNSEFLDSIQSRLEENLRNSQCQLEEIMEIQGFITGLMSIHIIFERHYERLRFDDKHYAITHSNLKNYLRNSHSQLRKIIEFQRFIRRLMTTKTVSAIEEKIIQIYRSINQIIETETVSESDSEFLYSISFNLEKKISKSTDQLEEMEKIQNSLNRFIYIETISLLDFEFLFCICSGRTELMEQHGLERFRRNEAAKTVEELERFGVPYSFPIKTEEKSSQLVNLFKIHVEMDTSRQGWSKVMIFPLFLTSAILHMEKHQLQSFVDSILTEKSEEKHMPHPRSLWLDYVDKACGWIFRVVYNKNWEWTRFLFFSLTTVLRQVVEKLGSEQMETLVLGLSRKMDQDSAIYKAFTRGNPWIIEALLSNFEDERRLEIRDKMLSNQQIFKNFEKKTENGYNFINDYTTWVEEELPYFNRIPEWLYIINRFVEKFNRKKRNDFCLKVAKLFFHKKIYRPRGDHYKFLANWCLEEYMTDKNVVGGKKRFREEIKRFFSHFTEKDIKAVLNKKEMKFHSFLQDLKERIKPSDLSQDEEIQQLVMAFNF